MFPILLSVSQMKNLCTTIELDPKGDKITFPASGLYSSPAEHSTMGHIVLDLTSLPYKPKSRERSAHPKRHVTFAVSEQNLHIQLTHVNLTKIKMTNLIVCPKRTAVSEDENDPPLVQTSRKEPVAEKRESVAESRVPTQVNSVWRDPSATLEQDVSGNSRERSEEVSISLKKSRR